MTNANVGIQLYGICISKSNTMSMKRFGGTTCVYMKEGENQYIQTNVCYSIEHEFLNF